MSHKVASPLEHLYGMLVSVLSGLAASAAGYLMTVAGSVPSCVPLGLMFNVGLHGFGSFQPLGHHDSACQSHVLAFDLKGFGFGSHQNPILAGKNGYQLCSRNKLDPSTSLSLFVLPYCV
jgi:hypothetical protein